MRPLAVTLALAAALGACTTWSQRPVPSPAGEQRYAGPVRVTRTEGRPVLLDGVTVGADSIVGRAHRNPDARIAIPISEVRRVEARRADPLATVVLVLATATAAVALWASYMLGRGAFYD